jgi:hypothetical protein
LPLSVGTAARVFRSVGGAGLLAALVLGRPALAAEVVWLEPPSAQDAARVGARAGALRGPLTPAAFRAGLSDVTPADAVAIDAVAAALEQVRVFEAELDGELKILAGLDAPLAQVRLVRDAADREVLVRALLYQGFAVDRFWGDTLGSDDAAAPYRVRIEDRHVERPWLDAFALDPLRAVADADIGEQPQREAYDRLRETLAEALHATVVAPDLPPGASLVVDGRTVLLDDTPLVQLVPGRHWLHVEVGGHVLARVAQRLRPGQRLEVVLPVPESEWRDLRRLLLRGEGVVPDGVRDVVEAWGGEVWFADGTGPSLRVWSVTPTQARPAPLAERPAAPPPAVGSPLADVSVAGWIGLGWMHSADFRNQDPDAVPAGAGVVNAVAPVLGAELAWDRDWLRYGVGVDVSVPLGADHVALSGAGRYRLRAFPHVLVGHPLVQGQLGWVAPYHVAGGLQGCVPVVDDRVEIRARLLVGVPPALVRPDGTSWQGSPLLTASLGVGGRLRPR